MVARAKCLFFFLFALLLGANMAYGQEKVLSNDTIIIVSDTVKVLANQTDGLPLIQEKEHKKLSPRKASLYSALLPGLGQAYNKSYWKIPLIYGGIAAFAYGIDWNNGFYNDFRTALFAEIDNDETTVNTQFPGLSVDNLRNRTDSFRRDRDFLIILAGVFYLLNIVDAHVEAHLKDFDLGDDLSLQLQPMIRQNNFGGSNVGFSLALNF